MASSASFSERPLWVSSYSTRTGLLGTTVRVNSPSTSSDLKRSDSMRSVMSGMADLMAAYLALP